MYNENHVERSAVMKRRSTRHVSKITTIASEFGNSAKIIVPRSWLRKRVISFLYSDFISKYPEERRKDE
jgi:putative transposon-encoded protein